MLRTCAKLKGSILLDGGRETAVIEAEGGCARHCLGHQSMLVEMLLGVESERVSNCRRDPKKHDWKAPALSPHEEGERLLRMRMDPHSRQEDWHRYVLVDGCSRVMWDAVCSIDRPEPGKLRLDLGSGNSARSAFLGLQHLGSISDFDQSLDSQVFGWRTCDMLAYFDRI